MHANEALQKAKARQIEEGNPKIGVSCLTASVENMQEQGVFETLVSKKHQIQLATQVVKMILKIDDLIENISI
jgi:T-complex protein 1 subunit epsilon